MHARASTSNGETFTSRNSRWDLSRSTNSIVRVTSTVTHSVTWGAEKAESTIAWPIILRTPLIGSRRSRSAASYEVVAIAADSYDVLADPEAACTSSRVIVPLGPLAATLAR